MKVEKEMKYVAPEVEVLEVEVEKGFEGSIQNPDIQEPEIGGGGLG